MPNPENLSVPQKGEVRNPAGRPKGSKNRSTIARRILELSRALPADLVSKHPDLEGQTTVEEVMTLVQIHKAIEEGDTPAYKAVMDSAYGAPKQEVDNTINLKGKPAWLGIAATKRDDTGEAPTES